MSDELKPCAHCAKPGIEVEQIRRGDFHEWSIECSCCCCRTDWYGSREAAVAAWNRRADEFGADDDYERRMDELLCRLTNGKWSKSRSYSVDFMVSCVDEAYDEIYDPPVDNAQADSREKLQTEVMATVSNLVKYCDAHPALFEKAKSWLDRQAAITERELCAKCEWPNLAAMPDLEQQERIAEQDRRIVEYAEQVDSLTAERDGLRRQLDITRDIAREFRDERDALRKKLETI